MTNNITLMCIGQNIRDMRKAQGFTQEGLAYHVDLARTYMGRVERGEQNISMLNLVKICLALQCNPGCIVPDYLVLKKLERMESDNRTTG